MLVVLATQTSRNGGCFLSLKGLIINQINIMIWTNNDGPASDHFANEEAELCSETIIKIKPDTDARLLKTVSVTVLIQTAIFS